MVAARGLGEALSESGDLTDEIVEWSFPNGHIRAGIEKVFVIAAHARLVRGRRILSAFDQHGAERLDGLLLAPALLSKVGNERRAWYREQPYIHELHVGVINRKVVNQIRPGYVFC